MERLKYILSILLVIWGLLITGASLLVIGPQIPFLTTATVIAIYLKVIKHRNSNLIFLIVAYLWVIAGADTIGFSLFFDIEKDNRIFLGMIPLLMGIGLVLIMYSKQFILNTLIKRLSLAFILTLLTIGSYFQKTTNAYLNCWYHLDNSKSYLVRFAETPDRNFAVELSSHELKTKVVKDALRYKGIKGYYCPETKIQVVTSFGRVISAEIIEFRNSEIDKKVKLDNPVRIPLNKVKHSLDILKPYIPSIHS